MSDLFKSPNYWMGCIAEAVREIMEVRHAQHILLQSKQKLEHRRKLLLKMAGSGEVPESIRDDMHRMSIDGSADGWQEAVTSAYKRMMEPIEAKGDQDVDWEVRS